MSKYWISLFCAVLISSISQILLKKSTTKTYGNFLKEYLNPWVISGYMLMILSTLCVIYGYRGVDYKNGAIIESLGYILILIFSRLFFQENITIKKLVGNLMILIGVGIFYI